MTVKGIMVYFSKTMWRTRDGHLHKNRDIVGLIVGLHGEEVSKPGLLVQGEPDEVVPGLVDRPDEEGEGQGGDPPLRGHRVEADHI